MAGRVSSPVFAGRLQEQAELRALFDRALGGASPVVTVGGEPGIGKTRLLAEASHIARGQGFRVLTGGCIDVGEGALPYVAVVEALRQLRDELDEGVLEGLVGDSAAELAPLLPWLGAPTAAPSFGAGRMFELLRELLDRLSETWPLLVAVEDIHWAGQSTRSLLSYLARNLCGRVVLVMTYRSGEVHERFPFRTFLAELHRNPRCHRLELGPLTQAEMTEVLGAILGVPASARLVGEIMARSDGNVFFAEELLAASGEGAELPPALRDLLLVKVAALSAGASEVVRAVAAAGSPVPHWLLAAVTGKTDAALLDQLREAVERYVLIARDDSYAFRHALVREAVYDNLLPGERRGLHAAFASELAAHSTVTAEAAPASDLGALAHHWYAAGVLEQALPAAVNAGLAAEVARAPGDAERHYERALQMWWHAPDVAARCPLDRKEVLRRAAETAHLAGDYGRAIALIGEALTAARDRPQPLRVSRLLERLGYCYIAGGDVDAAEAAYNAAVDAAPAAPATVERARALTGRAHLLLARDRNAAAADAAAEARQTARRVQARDTESRACNIEGLAKCNLGQLPEGLDLLATAERLAAEVDDIPTLLWTHSNVAEALLAVGRWREADSAAARVLPLAGSIGAAGYGAYGATFGAEALLLLGEWDAAQARVDQILATGAPDTALSYTLLIAATLSLWRGDIDGAVARLEIPLALSKAPAQVSRAYAIAAAVATAAGRLDEARGRVAEGLSRISRADAPQTTTRLCLAGLTAERARATMIPSPRRDHTPPSASVIARDLASRAREACAGESATALTVSMAELATAEATLGDILGDDGAERWRLAAQRWDDLATPYQAACAHLNRAQHLLAAGRPPDAAPDLEVAWQWAGELDAGPLREEIARLAQRCRASLPAGRAGGVAAGDGQLRLTGREREVLDLLVGGGTNRSIAARLFISEKTVSVHVSHILAKLGVTNRTAAAAVARRSDPA